MPPPSLFITPCLSLTYSFRILLFAISFYFLVCRLAQRFDPFDGWNWNTKRQQKCIDYVFNHNYPNDDCHRKKDGNINSNCNITIILRLIKIMKKDNNIWWPFSIETMEYLLQFVVLRRHRCGTGFIRIKSSSFSINWACVFQKRIFGAFRGEISLLIYFVFALCPRWDNLLLLNRC